MKKIIPSIFVVFVVNLLLNFVVYASVNKEYEVDGASSSDGRVAKSMDQMIEEHRLIADEMLETSLNTSDEAQPAKTVDDVYLQQNLYYAAEGSLDDLENKHRLEFNDLTQANQFREFENDSSGVVSEK